MTEAVLAPGAFRARTKSSIPAGLAALLVATAGFALAPWYYVEAADGGMFAGWPTGRGGSGLALALTGAWRLLPLILALALAAGVLLTRRTGAAAGRAFVVAGGLGLFWLCLQGAAIGLHGWNASFLATLFGAPGPMQKGMGFGAALTAGGFLALACRGLAMQGWCRGDGFVVASIGWVMALILLFVFFPVAKILLSAFQDNAGEFAPGLFVEKFFDSSVWGLGCLGGGTACGVAWNTLFVAVLVGLSTTALGLAFALIVTRSGFPAKGLLRVLTILPIITPPFVIGLALILLFGRSGAVSSLLWQWFGVPPSRWIYGLPGIFLAQTLAFTPIAFLVMIGVVQGVSPSLEEAAQTLRAKRATIFMTVTLPLIRPGLANAFLLGFVESMADFGNPLVLGGNFEVLSTKIFFAVVGAATDQGRAAVLSIILLSFTLAGFFVQQAVVGAKVYTTVTGKGDSGLPQPLPRGVARLCFGAAVPWAIFTFVVYAIILVGGFVKAMGRDYTPTLFHYAEAFRIEHTPRGWLFTGGAWPSLFSTIEIAAIAAPLTAAIGLLTGWLLTRQRFAGQRFFEFSALLSFAIPGTVVGVSYILAFNVPPVEITGTGLILIICFVFRNMPVGVRSAVATLSQIDKSLDEASLTLGARSFETMRRVMAPLLRPAIIASLVYSFVRAMTAVSAVIFLVSAEYNMATTYIIGRVDAGEYGIAIAYSSALIVIMLIVILAIQWLVGERKLGRRDSPAQITMPAG